MTPRYYTLITRESDGKWHPQFGAFQRFVVEDEASDSYRHYAAKDRKIITTGRGKNQIADKIAALNAKERPPMSDFIITDQGTLVGFSPKTEQAKAWINENVQSDGWQWMGNTLWVDHRMAEPLLEGIAQEGLTIA